MIIKNYQELASNQTRKEVLSILEAGIEAVEPRRMMSSVLAYNEDFNSVKVFNQAFDVLRGRIFVIGGGKSSGAMAEATERVIGSARIRAGVVACKDKHYHTKRIRVIKAGHPFPDWRSVRASKKILSLRDKYDIGEKDLVICLVSGGTSALLTLPVKEIALADMQRTTKLLFEVGADIHDINVIRKHLSRIKGGQIANYFAPAKVVSLIISDVVGDNIEVIGSGLTVPDPSTFRDAWNIIEKFDIKDKIPERVRLYLQKGNKGKVWETPKTLGNASNYLIGSNKRSLEAMAHRAMSLGLRPVIVGNDVEGDPNVMAYRIVRHILQDKFKNYDVLLYAGETNPTLPEKYGRGGRNQQFAAASMLALSHLKIDWSMASISTDGIDFDSKVAGAIVDSASLSAAEKKGIEVPPYVRTYDTYNLFKKMGQAHIRTGHTGANVADIMVYRLKHQNN